MTIQQLEYLIALDNHRNFVKAAESCLVTQPTLTMQLKKLEEEAGIQLFNRTQKPVSPTKTGVQFILKARSILREINELKQLVNNETDSVKGTFRLGIIPTLAPYLLPLFLPTFAKQNPETHLQIKELESENIIHQLKHNMLDIAILATPLEEKQLKEIILFYEPFWALFPDNHPLLSEKRIKAGQLSPNNLLLLSEGHCFREQTLNICRFKKAATKYFDYESGCIETIKNLIKKDAGYSLVPELSIIDELKTNKNLRPLHPPVPTREVSLVVHNSFSKDLLIEVLRKEILKNIPEWFHKNQRYTRIKWK